MFGTLCVGFVVFFLGDFLEAFGISEKLPLIVASFRSASISLLMGLTACSIWKMVKPMKKLLTILALVLYMTPAFADKLGIAASVNDNIISNA